MMRLFGGFGEECFAAYAEVRPSPMGGPTASHCTRSPRSSFTL